MAVTGSARPLPLGLSAAVSARSVVLPGGSGVGGDAGGAFVVVAECLGDDGGRGLKDELADGGGAALVGRDAEFPQRVALLPGSSAGSRGGRGNVVSAAPGEAI